MMRTELIRESEYAAQMRSVVVPYIRARQSDRMYEGHDGKPLHAACFRADDPRAAVVICHGFTESSEKYDEIVYYFLQNGYSVFLPEHRGHGQSYRKLGDWTLTHVDRFEEYVDDFEATIEKVVRAEWQGKLMLFAHSMGGAIGALYMERHPDAFDKAVLNSPMIAPQTGKAPAWLAMALTKALCLLGKGEKRSLTSKPSAEGERFETSCSTSRPRFDYYARKKRAEKHLSNNAPTYRWIVESIGVTRKILRPGAPERVKTQVLVIAAERDHLVKQQEQETLVSRLPGAEFCVMPGTKHETFSAADEIMQKYLDTIFTFFEKS